MKTIVSENRIKESIKSKMPPGNKYIINPKNAARVNREKAKNDNTRSLYNVKLRKLSQLQTENG